MQASVPIELVAKGNSINPLFSPCSGRSMINLTGRNGQLQASSLYERSDGSSKMSDGSVLADSVPACARHSHGLWSGCLHTLLP